MVLEGCGRANMRALIRGCINRKKEKGALAVACISSKWRGGTEPGKGVAI